MHFSSAITTIIAGLSLGAMASPISSNTTEIDSTLERRANSCSRTQTSQDAEWSIYLDNDAYYNINCGNGCLNNIRGRCGVVTKWGCTRDNNRRAHMTFYTTIGCTAYDMTQALHACTKKEQTINC